MNAFKSSGSIVIRTDRNTVLARFAEFNAVAAPVGSRQTISPSKTADRVAATCSGRAFLGARLSSCSKDFPARISDRRNLTLSPYMAVPVRITYATPIAQRRTNGANLRNRLLATLNVRVDRDPTGGRSASARIESRRRKVTCSTRVVVARGAAMPLLLALSTQSFGNEEGRQRLPVAVGVSLAVGRDMNRPNDVDTGIGGNPFADQLLLPAC